ncbi:RHS repeat-associated core domain-containing protein [Nonomuraea sp. MG754425]|uniref:RHS repeat domain-containing protein n=1 Tax=Nonomuraea sp. MG754425 TaxID=2570319 RepID=UPI001F161DFD|nr:RHS repeat-associated core domain-containing protein [Nonomuraea sp. MG754425]MCF6472822.1 RHS repeat-associated core domain-containing protein [Nonomuraea sp. MG754425]
MDDRKDDDLDLDGGSDIPGSDLELELPESRWGRPRAEQAEIADPAWNRFEGARPERARWHRKLAVALSAMLVIDLVYAMPAHAEPRSAPAVQRETPISGERVPVRPPLEDPAVEKAWQAPPDVRWPAPQKAELGGNKPLAAGFPVKPAAGTARAAAPVTVELLDTDRPGLTMRVSPGEPATGSRAAQAGRTRLEIDYSGFRYAYGGDYGSRLHLVKLSECALTGAAGCAAPEPVKSDNDAAKGTVTAEVETDGLYALTAAESGPSGDYAATSLSASAEWSVGIQSGDFTWNYDMRTPPALGGDEPDIALGYSSQSVDGRTAATNNQTSWAGEGFDLDPGGYIERRYKSCSLDGKKTGDQCWNEDNATLYLNGSSVELIKDATTKKWRPRRDDGTRIEALTGATNGDDNGEYWRVTDPSGIQYTFGLNRLPGWTSGKPETKSAQTVPVFGNNSGEPCHSGTPADAWCQQAYRWNLDYAVDTHGNATTYWYEQEKNYYGRNGKPELGTPYVRGAYLTRIDYGYLKSELFTRAPATRVLFEVAERCLPGGTVTCAPDQLTKETAGRWPDVPFDQICNAGVKCTDRLSATFFTRKRLSKVTTQVRNPAGQYYAVDSWALTHSFPASGDGTSPSLWLTSIQRTGHVGGTLTTPPITFTGLQLPNRVDGQEGRAPLVKWRVQAVGNGTGGELRVNYQAGECKVGALPAADKNAKLCFPQRWSPKDSPEVTDWFHKYVVAQTVEVDRVGGSADVVTDYEYLDGAGWRYAQNLLVKPEHRSWSDFRGFGRVRVRAGDGKDTGRTLTEYRYFRGMDGDRQADGSKRVAQVEDSEGGKLDDLDHLAGFEREKIVFDGDGGAVSTATVDEPWSVKTAQSTQDGVTKAAYVVQPKSSVTRTALADGRWRRTGEERAFDGNGLLLQVHEKGDLASATDDQCTRVTYARNDSAWMLDYLSRVQKVAAGCGTAVAALAADQVISDQWVQYDGQPVGQAPIRGDVTTAQELVSADGTTITRSTRTYDVYGRELAETDALGTRSVTAYNPATGALATETTQTNQLGHTEKTVIEPAWGEPVAEIDANGRRVDLAYDPLGQLTKVWQPDRSKAAGNSPNTEYAYTVRDDGPNVVTARTLRADGGYTASHELFDGLMRKRQTQEPAPADDQATDPALRDGRTITDTVYNSQGEAFKENTGYFATGTPATELLGVADAAVPSQVVSLFDGRGEVNAQILKAMGGEKYRMSTREEGDRVHVTPLAGGTATTRIGDAEDRLIELRQYRGATPTGEYDATKYTYDPAGRLSTVTDPAGNVWRHHYDFRGREIKTEDPDKGVTTTTYNDADEVVTTTDARGRTLWYGYDALGRKTQLRDGSATGTLLTEWKYDTLAKNHMDASIRYAGGQAYKAEINAVDADYRPLRQTITVPEREGKLAGSYVLNTRYTLDGQVQSVSFPAGGGLAEETVVYSYDALGQPAKVAGLSAYVGATRYSKMGETLQYELGEGTKKTWLTYTHEESTRRLTGMRLDRSDTTATDLDLAYGHDPVGNITKITDRAGGQDTQCFTYDHLRRMTSAWTATDDCASGTPDKIGGIAPYAVSYAYDKTGNRTKETKHAWGGAAEQVRTFTYPEAGGKQPHALKAVGADLFEYDATGNTTRRKVGTKDQSLVWDAEGNLESVTEAGKTTSFVYDADGDRLLRKTPADTTLYIDDMELRLDHAENAVEQTRYYTVNNQPMAVRTPDGQVYFLANDHQGTAQAAVRAATGELAIRRQTPFGEERGTPPPWWPGQRGFVGGTQDTDLGLVHLGAREYDPANGRFLSVDPVIDAFEPQQLNAYAYANNSPVTMSDPDGLFFRPWNLWPSMAAYWAYKRYQRYKAEQARKRREAEARRRREEARRRWLAELRRRLEEAARKKMMDDLKKREEAARKRAAKEAAAKKRAEVARQRAREEAARRRAARRVAAALAAAAAARAAAAKQLVTRAGQPQSKNTRPPASRPTSHRTNEQETPPKAQRNPVKKERDPLEGVDEQLGRYDAWAMQARTEVPTNRDWLADFGPDKPYYSVTPRSGRGGRMMRFFYKLWEISQRTG